ncbi:1167_t:CDS:2, partial [Dentiscutata erythropus]
LEDVFDINIEQINEIPLISIEAFEEDIKDTVKLLKHLDCSNESTKAKYISQILVGVVDTFSKADKISLHKEYSLSGVNGNESQDTEFPNDVEFPNNENQYVEFHINENQNIEFQTESEFQ